MQCSISASRLQESYDRETGMSDNCTLDPDRRNMVYHGNCLSPVKYRPGGERVRRSHHKSVSRRIAIDNDSWTHLDRDPG